MGENASEVVQATTGDPRVDAIVARLDEVETLGVSDRTAAFAQLHGDLAAVLDGDDDQQPAHHP